MLSIGLMSGTSMDGVDGAILRTDGESSVKMGAVASLRYAPPFHHALKIIEHAVRSEQGNVHQANENFDLHAITYAQSLGRQRLLTDIENYLKEFPSFFAIIDHLTDLHACVVEELLAREKVSPQEVSVVGFHGQNLYHRPNQGVTRQVGNALRLTNRLGIPVVYNFRQNDVMHGGQGAPFAPLYHQALVLRDTLAPAAIVNCGGVSNITFAWSDAPVMGFDTGPGNGLVDLYIKCATQGRETYDQDGRYGRQGSVLHDKISLLEQSFCHFLNKKPPKSLDIADFSYGDLLSEASFVDAVRTLEEFTALCIVRAIDHLPPQAALPTTWILGGGGWKNPIIYEVFTQRLIATIPNARPLHVEEMGWSNEGLEAQIFAYLAVRSLKGLPLSLPSTTGVPLPLTGGEIVYPDAKTAHFWESQEKKSV